MASSTQCLVVSWIPHELLFSLVWRYVVNDCSGHHPSFFQMLNTKGMRSQVTDPVSFPRSIIATLLSTTAFLLTFRLVNLAQRSLADG